MTDKALDERPDRDPEVAALYRSASRDEPPSRLDDAIRAAARRAVGARPGAMPPRFSRRWALPVAIAAVLVLSVSLVVHVREAAPPELAELHHADVPRPAGVPSDDRSRPVESASVTPEGNTVAATTRNKEGADIARRERESAPQSTAGPSRAPLPPSQPEHEMAGEGKGVDTRPVAPSPKRDEPLVTQPPGQAPLEKRLLEQRPSAAMSAPAPAVAKESRQRAESGSSEQDRQQVPGGAMLGTQKAERAASGTIVKTEQPPEKWLAEIEDLLRQGRTEEARHNFAEFVKRHPDYRVSPALREALRP